MNDIKQLKSLTATHLKTRPELLKTIRKDFLMILDLNAMLVDLKGADYSNLLDKVNAYLNNKEFNIRADFTAKVMALNIIAHLENGNHLLLENLIRNTQRFMAGNKTLKNEQRVLKWLKQWVNEKMQNKLRVPKHKELLDEVASGAESDYPVFYSGLRGYVESVE